MKNILVGWIDDGERWHTVLTVEKGKIVRIKPPSPTKSDEAPSTNGNVVVQPSPAEVAQYSKKYAGDHIANGLAKMGVKPCGGCNKRKAVINAADKKLRGMFTRA